MDDFETLEKLNAQIDVWIDDEEYDRIFGQEKGSLRVTELDDSLKTHIDECFRSTKSTHGKDPAWYNALNLVVANPIKRVHYEDLEGGVADVNAPWAPLFYAKLFRSRIKQRGTDCFNRRLDDVLQYLEKQFPSAYSDDEEKRKRLIRLTIIHLLELSAISRDYESLGFSQRARRLIRQSRQLLTHEISWFYDLWAGYNIGVAYFHIRRYRLAIQEFNYIIKEVRETYQDIAGETKDKKKQEKREYFESHLGNSLIYIPSVLYRADIQLKLQLAYHALDTLNRYFWPEYIEGTTCKIEKSLYKDIHGLLISAEANQQTSDRKNSWDNLREACGKLLNKDKSKVLRKRVTQPPIELFDSERKQYGNLKERFIDLFVEDELDWLEDKLNQLKSNKIKLKVSSDLTELEKEKIKTDCEKDEKEIINCARMLKNIFSSTKYFKRVRFYAYGRQGYYQQLAKLLAWLAKKDETRQDDKFYKMAEELYEENKSGLMQDEEKMEKVGCPDCEWQGIGLYRINLEHYKWFTDAMLDFYKNMVEHYESIKPQCSPDEQEMKKYLDDDREEFIKRLIKVEREYREDLRIKDLDLRYRSRVVTDELCSGKDGAKLCLGEQAEIRTNFNKAFANLLECAEKDECKDETLNKHQYKQIMNQWKGRFKRHLECESIHQRHSNGLYFIGLQRWNSASPAQGRSVGGGYLLYHTNKQGTVDLGIAIDPGFDFLRNLFHMGFSLNDIDIILISHAHMDHIRDFESIAVLLDQLKKQVDKKKVIHVILTLGAYERLKHIIEDPAFRYYIEPYIIDVHREIDEYYFEHLPSDEDNFRFVEIEQSTNHGQQPMRYKAIPPSNVSTSASRGNRSKIKVDIKPTRAYHSDPSNYSDSFGFLIEVMLPSGDKATLGYTGDTKWVYPEILDLLKDRYKIIKDISQQYGECDAVVVHLGSLIDDREFEYYYQCKPTGGEECENLVRKKDHPYLVGMLRLLSRLYSLRKSSSDKQLILLGEFGEELRGGIRTDLIKRLKQTYEHRLDFLPIDVGMDVKLWPKQDYKSSESQSKQMVWCVQCGDFVSIEEAKFEPYGVDEALYCVCKTCKKATPLNVLQDRLRQLYEVGRELRTREGE